MLLPRAHQYHLNMTTHEGGSSRSRNFRGGRGRGHRRRCCCRSGRRRYKGRRRAWPSSRSRNRSRSRCCGRCLTSQRRRRLCWFLSRHYLHYSNRFLSSRHFDDHDMRRSRWPLHNRLHHGASADDAGREDHNTQHTKAHSYPRLHFKPSSYSLQHRMDGRFQRQVW